MRTLRAGAVVGAALALFLCSGFAAHAQADEAGPAVSHVAGSLEVRLLPGGTFDVEDRVYQYRHFPMGGSLWHVSDHRLAGHVLSDWSWDVEAHGGEPVPSWGTITITRADGGWEGSFSGIQYRDFEPVAVHADLIGSGDYEGLHAMLDILATGTVGRETWMIDGVVQPIPPAE